MKSYIQISPVLEECCLLVGANEAYMRGESDVKKFTGISIGHTTRHRKVQEAELKIGNTSETVESLSVDGGKIRIRASSNKSCVWKDYKMIS
ncbi:MAG: hypothetical protein DSM107014_11495 [Gomphosphaeria aponina SAG 52.96 = DSM 107014]|uniref:Uncharacterized protein n=1 Tax=Gomphosphaeria aponina SAG 52.96 = DSM 107014 TaxID=1521640 RepID=A0A941GQK2_9CHRO|nr:hypothetical protein [Gomphosphaeria aponina SAG 52.96 = DSM 107014]